MEHIVAQLIVRFRPHVGWGRALAGVSATLIVAGAAGSNLLKLPVGPFLWAGLLGCPLGLVVAPPRDMPRTAVRTALAAVCILIGVALLALSVGQALPPVQLVWQDLGALATWLGSMSRVPTAVPPFPGGMFGFFASAVPRFWAELLAAPGRGEIGARLLVATGGSAMTWLGAFALGWGLQRGRWLLVWELPLFAGLLLVVVLGGNGAWFVSGAGLLALLAIDDTYRRAARDWEAHAVDYSPELQRDLLAWGGGLISAVLCFALLLPAWLGNPVAVWVWEGVQTPSGLTALEAPAPEAQRSAQSARQGLSTLPALALGVSLEQADPDQVALRVTVDKPLPQSGMPHYWRARVYNLYTGSGWTSDARVRNEPALALGGTLPVELLLQQVEDARSTPGLLIGVAEIVGVDVETRAERLADGSLAALAAPPGVRRYQVASILQENAAPPAVDVQPPDMTPFMVLPQLPPRVAETARALTGGATNDTARALALESYLRSLPYSYQVAPLPADGDAVDQFLFDMRQGYCTYYASAMAVMARSLGIPARIASGYATGEYDPVSHSYTLYERLAHAWPELYIGGQWTAFEPTPVLPLPARDQAQPRPATPPQPVTPSPSRGPLIWFLALALLVLLAALGLRRRTPLPAPALLAQAEIETLGRRAGLAWPPGATLHEYAALLARRIDGVAPTLNMLVDLIVRARYRESPLDAQEAHQLDVAWRDLRARARELRQR